MATAVQIEKQLTDRGNLRAPDLETLTKPTEGFLDFHSKADAVILRNEGQWSSEPNGGSSMARRRYQKGTLVLRGKLEKRWFGQYREDVVDSTGSVKRVLRKVYIGTLSEYPSKRLAQRRLDIVLSRINAESYRPGRVATLAEFVERWRVDILAMEKPSSIKAAESHLRCHIIPRLGSVKLEEISQETVQQLVSSLSKKLARHTLLNVLGTLGSILKAARSWKYVCGEFRRDDLVLPSARLTKPVRFFSAEQVTKIIEAAKEEPYRTMFVVAALTGLRAGEICGLSVDDLDFERRSIHIRRSAWYGRLQTPKSRSAVRTIPIPDILSAVLKAYLRVWIPNPSRLLFATKTGRPHSANKIVQRKLWPLLDALEIPRCGFHAFRHAASTILVDDGAPVTVTQAQLGHSDPRTTLGIYSHVVPETQRSAMNKLARILMPDDANKENTTKWVQ